MANDEKITITDGEMRVLKAMFANMKSKPDIDWDAAAIDAELGSAKSIKERHRQICVRLGWNNKSGSGGAAAAQGTTKRTRAAPSKVVKRTAGGGRKKKVAAAEEDDVKMEEEEEEETKPAVAAPVLNETGEF